MTTLKAFSNAVFREKAAEKTDETDKTDKKGKPSAATAVPNSGAKDAFPYRQPAPQFPEERAGWTGYIEWEKYPGKKEHAAEVLAQYQFPGPPEYQLVPVPFSNPLLEGVRWKQYHYAMGDSLKDIPDISWKYVQQEKSEDMIHILQFPYNGEPPRSRLVETEITSNKDFFIRNHGGVPEIEEDAYFVEMDGLLKKPQHLTLADLKNEELFPRQTNVVSLQCSGTRRIEQIHEYPGDGDELINAPWGEGAIGTARWTGVSLRRVIEHCGGFPSSVEDENDVHIEFYGADTYFKKGHVYNYVVSVPWRKCKYDEVLLAWDMNGEPLPHMHGFPLRTVVFGYIGARSCKWLYKIKAIIGPSQAPVQKKEYLYYTPQIGKQNAMYSNGFSIQDMPVSSAIMTPLDKDQIVHDGFITLRGWAYSGGGHWPERVEVSADGGSVWYEVPYERMSQKYYYAWRIWSIEIPVEYEGWLEFCCRTWDNALNTQPTFVRSAWNFDTHVTSSCHRIKVYSINRNRADTRARLQELEARGLSMTPITQPLTFDLETEEHYQEVMKLRGGRDPKE